MEWLAIPAGIIAGIFSGWAAAWVGRPAAQTTAEEVKIRQAERRTIVADARTALAKALAEDWNLYHIKADPRLFRLSGSVEGEAKELLERPNNAMQEVLIEGALPMHLRPNQSLILALKSEVDRLEREWNLI